MITFYQGNSVDINLSVFRADNGAAFDITGSKIWFTIKSAYTDPDSSALLQVTSDTSAISFVNPTMGTAVISLTPASTQSLPTGVALRYDVQIKTAANKVYTITVDNVTVMPKVTDALT